MIARPLCLLVLLIFSNTPALAKTPDPTPNSAIANYMANEGLMVVQGETKVVFDPLFRNSYGHYQLLPKAMEEALFAGAPPIDGIDAILISLSSRVRRALENTRPS